MFSIDEEIDFDISDEEFLSIATSAEQRSESVIKPTNQKKLDSKDALPLLKFNSDLFEDIDWEVEDEISRNQQSNSKFCDVEVAPLSAKPSTALRSATFSNNSSLPRSSNIIEKITNSNTVKSSTKTSLNNPARLKTAKRKFPGPAGVLPKLKSGVDLNSLKPTIIEADLPLQTQVDCANTSLTSTQPSSNRFEEEAWQEMLRDLDAPVKNVLSQYTVEKILQQACNNSLPYGKVPITSLYIDSLVAQGSAMSADLLDKTGCIKGTIHKQLLKEWGDQIQIGSVIVLTQVSVFSPSSCTHYLNITPRCLVRVYCNSSCFRVNEFNAKDFVSSTPLMRRGNSPGSSMFSASHSSGLLGCSKSTGVLNSFKKQQFGTNSESSLVSNKLSQDIKQTTPTVNNSFRNNFSGAACGYSKSVTGFTPKPFCNESFLRKGLKPSGSASSPETLPSLNNFSNVNASKDCRKTPPLNNTTFQTAGKLTPIYSTNFNPNNKARLLNGDNSSEFISSFKFDSNSNESTAKMDHININHIRLPLTPSNSNTPHSTKVSPVCPSVKPIRTPNPSFVAPLSNIKHSTFRSPSGGYPSANIDKPAEKPEQHKKTFTPVNDITKNRDSFELERFEPQTCSTPLKSVSDSKPRFKFKRSTPKTHENN